MSSGLSLSTRLLFATALTLLVFLGLVYVALEQAFVSSVTRTEAEKLHSTILLLLAEAEADDQGLTMPEALQEARFNQLDSGLYGFVFDAQGGEVWRSFSAIAMFGLPEQPGFRNTSVGQDSFGLIELDQEAYLYATMGVAWEWESGSTQSAESTAEQRALTRHYTFALLESADFFRAELGQFRQSLLIRLLAVAGVLLIAQLLVLRLGLRPLKRLTDDVHRVEQGDISELSGRYPEELQRLADNLNQLLAHEHAQREQYKNRLSDLAHSLKTPLSIASGALLEKSQDRQLLAEQLQQMDQIVQYQLQRANRARPAIAQQQLLVGPVIERLSEALKKVYSDKGVRLDLELSHDARTRMDESDLLELLGNVLDNAFKYCDSRVQVSLRSTEESCSVSISDDGPGIPASQREEIFARGQRLDTQRPGQGIGLAVVKDIMRSYQAQMSIHESSIGGARFEIVLPA